LDNQRLKSAAHTQAATSKLSKTNNVQGRLSNSSSPDIAGSEGTGSVSGLGLGGFGAGVGGLDVEAGVGGLAGVGGYEGCVGIGVSLFTAA